MESTGSAQGEGQAEEDGHIQKERDRKSSDNTQNYILALGMDYAAAEMRLGRNTGNIRIKTRISDACGRRT